MRSIGYQFLRERLALPVFAVAQPAQVAPVSRLSADGDALRVPAAVAPASDDVLDHVLFALKHEGVNLQVLSLALPRVAPERMLAALAVAPNGRFIRIACHLWEAFSGKQLPVEPPPGAHYAAVFDARRYHTGASRRDARWRVDFNGLGDLRWCPTVRRTAAVERLVAADILQRARRFVHDSAPQLVQRTLAWAYLHETHSSYAIERERPAADKASAFAALLRQAHAPRELSEQYLVELHSAVMSNPLERAVEFRSRQNWLRNGLRGALGVSYVPPEPDVAVELMDALMAFANGAREWPRLGLDPLVAAAVASFGFVFIHPFMDGNGRLSRFLLHKALCLSGQLDGGMLLPVSAAMQRNEHDYLQALQSFSAAARELVGVTWLGEDRFAFERRPGAVGTVFYRYWDATACVEFSLRMAEQALQVDLQRQALFLSRFDAVQRAVQQRFDVRGPVLATLVALCLDSGGVISKNKRKRYADVVQPQAFDCIEQAARAALAEGGEAQALAVQVKEKFGGLRFYVHGGLSARQEELIETAEALAERTCEECGQPGRLLVRGHWYLTRCARHAPQDALTPQEYVELRERQNALLDAVPQRSTNGGRAPSPAYVCLADIPEPARAQFRQALLGKPPSRTAPQSEQGECAWASDWRAWVLNRWKGEPSG